MDSSFGVFLKNERSEQKISCEKLGRGLCSRSTVGKIEQGERGAGKLLRDRLQGRLGLTDRTFEVFLQATEYEKWYKREQVLNAIESNKLEVAEGLLEEYESQVNLQEKLEYQRLLCMQVQYLRKTGKTSQEMYSVLKKAADLTIPQWEQVPLKQLLLSVEEIDILLECTSFQSEKKEKGYYEILEYIEQSNLEGDLKVKIYPKVCYYLCRDVLRLEKENAGNYNQIIKLCNQGIEILREEGKMYFLWELLELRKNAIQKLKKYVDNEHLEQMEKETDLWKESLKIICYEAFEECSEEYADKVLQTTDSCFIYREKEMYSFSEVIKRRRKMFGLSRKQLCEDVCSMKTLRRIEIGEVATQPFIVKKLLERVGLSGECQSMHVVSSKRSIWKLVDEEWYCTMERKTKEAEALLEKLKKKLDLRHPVNVQYVLRENCLLLDQKKRLTKQEYIEAMKEAMECTMPLSALETSKEIYLTLHEMLCLYSIMTKLPECKEKRKYIGIFMNLYMEYEENDTLSSWIRQYELVMSHVSSHWGNIGAYEKSNYLARKVMQYDLRCKRMNMFYISYHNIIWNEKQHMNLKDVEQLRTYKDKLETCITLAQLEESLFYEKYYREEINELDYFPTPGLSGEGSNSSRR